MEWVGSSRTLNSMTSKPLCLYVGLQIDTLAEMEHILIKKKQWWWLGQCSYVLTCALAKISISVGVLRLTVKRLYSIILWTIVAVTSIVGIVFWFILTLQCHPVSHFWQRFRPGHCISVDTVIIMAWVYSIAATLCDFTLATLPIFLIWNLQMNTRSKIALAGILGMAGM